MKRMVSDKEESPRQGSRSRSRSSSRSSSRASDNERKSRSPSRENREDNEKLEAQRSQENGIRAAPEEKKQVEERRRSRSKSGSASRSSSSSASRSRSRSRSPSKSSRRRRHSSERRTRRRRSKSSRSGSRRSSRSHSRPPRGHRGRDRHRSRSRSPYYRRANPSPCRVLGVFGLNYQTEEREIRRVFEKYGPVEKVKLVTDPRTGRSRGFSFIYFDAVEDAEEAKDKMHGRELDGSYVRVEFSISNREHHPTPGVYMGRRTSARYYEDDYYDSYRGGSKRAYSRSRSRSRSYDRTRRRRRSYSRDY